ncbi:hypothetical protein FACS1894122_14520 [Alphaproteobacteria bacterium]|nr:hypothetical protein FACS1894122_14520 [Alphaproteobacteria bacterium]
MIYGYVRVSAQNQSMDSHKQEIKDCREEKFHAVIDEWFDIGMSSRKSTKERRIDELIEKLKPGDSVITYELSRLGRSTKETL